MKWRIVFVIPTMDRGGAEKQVCLLAANLPRDIFDVHVLLLTRGGPREATLRESNVPYTIIGKGFKFDPTAYYRLKTALKTLSPHIVHTYLFAANSYGRAAAVANRVPVVIASERCVDPWKTWRHGLIDRYLARKSTAITTNSSGVRDFYVGRGIPAELFHIIPNGIEAAPNVALTRDEVAARLGIDPSRKWICAVGRLWPQKQYRDLIWAGEMINTLRNDDTTLAILGDGPQRGELIRYRDSISNDRRICFLGERPDVVELLPQFDAYWLASAYEGQSNSLMEAMRVGLPCIVSDIPGNRDLIEHDVTGVLVKLNDAADFVRQTQHLWTHDDLRNQVCQSAAARIRDVFTIKAMIDAHRQLYEKLCGNI